jgi:hypothetical protein
VKGVILVAKKKAEKKEEEYKTCTTCNKNMRLNNFYSSKSSLFHDKYIPFCKTCLRGMVDEEKMDTVYRTLQAIDKPFLKDVWKKAKQSKNNTFGDYMRMVSSLHQYRDLSYSNSIFPTTDEEFYDEYDGFYIEESKSTEEDYENHSIDNEMMRNPQELRSKWGNYSNREIIEMEHTYQEMILANDISTPQHRKQLQFYCKLSMLMDKALQEKDFGTFEKLSRQFDTLIKSSGFRPIDRKSSDEATGMRNFSTIFQEVERNGFVPPVDVTLVENQDIVDRTILYYANYVRKLVGMESLSNTPSDTPKIEGEKIK